MSVPRDWNSVGKQLRYGPLQGTVPVRDRFGPALDDQAKPLLVVICGLDKPFRTELSDADYRHVRALGGEYLRRNPRSLA